MTIYIGADHQGFALKEVLKKFLSEKGYSAVDCGNDKLDKNDDYPDFSRKVANEVLKNLGDSRGIVICRSGVGVDMAANRFKGVRCVLAINAEQAVLSRQDDNTNVLALAAGFLTEEEAEEIIRKWLATEFSREERHKRRIEKIESENYPN